MPLFEYKCKQCGHTMELLQRSGHPGVLRCEKCGSKTLQKLVSTFSTGQDTSTTGGSNSCPTGMCRLG